MADIKLYFKKLFPWEGGYVNDPLDSGGATKMGVTLATWKTMGYDKDLDGDIDEEDIKLLSRADAEMVCKKGYWDKWLADQIKNQSQAEQLVDWVWGSGCYGLIIPQHILGVHADGVVGPITLTAVNSSNQEEFFNKVKAERLQFIQNIITRKPSQKRFEIGWKRRVNSFVFKP